MSKVPAGLDRLIKTAGPDALNSARYLPFAELTPATLHDSRNEVIRDVARALENAVRRRLKGPQEINALPPRRGQHSLGKAV